MSIPLKHLLTMTPIIEIHNDKKYLVLSFNDGYEMTVKMLGNDIFFRDLYIEEPNFSDMQQIYKISAKLNTLATCFEIRQNQEAQRISTSNIKFITELKRDGLYDGYLKVVEEEKAEFAKNCEEKNTTVSENAEVTAEQEQDFNEDNFARTLISQVIRSANEMDDYFTIVNDIIKFISNKCYIMDGAFLREMPNIEVNEYNAFKNIESPYKKHIVSIEIIICYICFFLEFFPSEELHRAVELNSMENLKELFQN